MSRKSHRFSLVEVLVIVGVVALVLAVLLPAMQASQARASSSRCQNRLRQLVSVYKKAEFNVGAKLTADSLRQHLGDHIDGMPDIWICPSLDQPGTASFGFNDRLHRLHDDDGGRIVALDYSLPVARVTGHPVESDWENDVRPRHFGSCNVAFYDGHVESRRPPSIDPRSCENQVKYWMPTLEIRQLPIECQMAVKNP